MISKLPIIHKNIMHIYKHTDNWYVARYSNQYLASGRTHLEAIANALYILQERKNWLESYR